MFGEENTLKKLVKSSLFSLGLALGLSAVLMPIISLVLSFLSDPAPYIFPAGAAILYVCAIAGGFFSEIKTQSIAAPLIPGGVLSLVVLLVSCLMPGKATLGPLPLILAYVAIPLAFFVGGLLHHLMSAKRPKRNRRRKRK